MNKALKGRQNGKLQNVGKKRTVRVACGSTRTVVFARARVPVLPGGPPEG